jgi:hypothetical protein
VIYELITFTISNRYTHSERGQPHKWSFFLTTKRDVPSHISSKAFGGDFYITKYRILVRAAVATMLCWEPSDTHGTTVLDIEPQTRETTVYQAGIAIVTSNRISKLWEAYKKKNISQDTAQEQVEMSTDGEDCNFTDF